VRGTAAAARGSRGRADLARAQQGQVPGRDFGRLRDLDAGVIVTSRSDDPGFDFVSRFFGPAFGIDEDPVTGSAHCHSGPYWQDRLGKDELMARQVSRRVGVVRVRMSGDRTLLGGQAVTVFRGELEN
jgi:predicted PhzF superfamily epimerase YddE/YHI9